MAIMAGREKLELRRYELATFAAWQSARFAREERLGPVDRYIKELRGPEKRPKQTPQEMLAALRAIKASNAGIN